MSPRADKLRVVLEEPLLVTSPVNVFYLSGFHSSNAALLVEPERLRLFTDFRYADAARSVEGVEFEEIPRNLLSILAEQLDGPIGFESEHVSYASWQTLGEKGLELVPRAGLVERLRAVKDEDELEKMRLAAKVTSGAFEKLAQEGFVGRTEHELAWRMTELFQELGAEGGAFSTIVAAGPNAARPHSEPGERRIEANETVVVDAGAMLDGYSSDCTRTFATGPLPEELQRAYDVCLEAQLASLEAVRAGAVGVAVDGVARKTITDAGFGEKFGHGLGHGVGIAVHEAPRLGVGSTDVLEPGNVVTVEPGIYLEGSGGIRIEDLVVVGEDGPEILTSFTKELVTVQ